MFKSGDGGEMCERKSKSNKWLPPKMASTASSSRLAYNLFSSFAGKTTDYFLTAANGDTYSEVDFEVKLPKPSDIPGKPSNMDVVLYGEKSLVFIEVKCHEIYKKSKKVIAKAYKPYLDCGGINYHQCGNAKYEINLCTSHFDVKQTISHLICIANYASEHYSTIAQKQVVFVDLIYDPNLIEDEHWCPLSAKRDAIGVYDQVLSEILGCPITDWFASFLNEINRDISVNFSYVTASQIITANKQRIR
jgi:hypothetical protein